MIGHERWVDAAAAYVLGALPDDELREFQAHVVDCPACQAEIDKLLPAAEALPVAAMPVDPPPALRVRIMAEVEREADLLRAAGSEADRPPAAAAPRRRRTWLGTWRLAPAAAALLAAGALAGVGVSTLTGEDAHTITATVDREQAPDASAELHVTDGEAMLTAENLPAPPSGRVYQVWLMKRGATAPEPTPTLFVPRSDGTAVAGLPGELSDYEAVLVTDEPTGGSDSPTRTPLLSVAPS